MIIGISSKQVSLVDLSVLVRFAIKPRLMGVPGVANVAVWGQRMRQLQVQVDQDRLLREGVTLDQVIKTAGNAMWVSPLTYLEASTTGTGGWIDTPSQRLAIQHVQPISSPSDLAQVNVEGTLLALSDVANVVEGHPPPIGDALLKGEPGLLLVVEKLPEVHSREVVRGVDTALNALRQGLPGIEIDFLNIPFHELPRDRDRQSRPGTDDWRCSSCDRAPVPVLRLARGDNQRTSCFAVDADSGTRAQALRGDHQRHGACLLPGGARRHRG